MPTLEQALIALAHADALLVRLQRANELHAVYTITDSFEYRTAKEKIEEVFASAPRCTCMTETKQRCPNPALPDHSVCAECQTSEEWFEQHHGVYEIPFDDNSDLRQITFFPGHAVLASADDEYVTVNLDTAGDCLRLLAAFKVTPISAKRTI